MFDYVDQLPNGSYKVLLQFFSRFYDVCFDVYETCALPVRDVLQNMLTELGLSEKWSDVIMDVISIPSNNWWLNTSLGAIIVGGTLTSILVFGIIKYFTDIVL